MFWHLLPNLNACIAGDQVILLDVERDRYFALPSAIAVPTMAWLQARDGCRPPHQLEALLLESLGERRVGAGIANQRLTVIALEQTFPDVGGRRAAGARAIASVSLAVTATWLALRSRRLRAILHRRQDLRARGAALDPSILRDLGNQFAAARPWCPIAPNCLLDSLTFDHWLGCPSNGRIVFGVIGHPFEAHCWVQSDGTVLNDSYDRVSRFEPILAI